MGDLRVVVALASLTRYADWLPVDDRETLMLMFGKGWWPDDEEEAEELALLLSGH